MWGPKEKKKKERKKKETGKHLEYFMSNEPTKYLTNLLAELSKGHIVNFTEWLSANS